MSIIFCRIACAFSGLLVNIVGSTMFDSFFGNTISMDLMMSRAAFSVPLQRITKSLSSVALGFVLLLIKKVPKAFVSSCPKTPFCVEPSGKVISNVFSVKILRGASKAFIVSVKVKFSRIIGHETPYISCFLNAFFLKTLRSSFNSLTTCSITVCDVMILDSSVNIFLLPPKSNSLAIKSVAVTP